MQTYSSRHTHDIDINAPTRARLWNEQLVAVHHPDHVTGGIRENDNESLDPEDFPAGPARKAARSLRRPADDGGFVCAQYHNHDECLTGKIAAQTPIKLLHGMWGSGCGNDGRPAVLKAVPFQLVKLAQALQHRPRRGTLQRWWQDGGVIGDIVAEAG